MKGFDQSAQYDMRKSTFMMSNGKPSFKTPATTASNGYRFVGKMDQSAANWQAYASGYSKSNRQRLVAQ